MRNFLIIYIKGGHLYVQFTKPPLHLGGGLHGDVSCNLSTLVRIGGGRLNECKSNEGICRREGFNFFGAKRLCYFDTSTSTDKNNNYVTIYATILYFCIRLRGVCNFHKSDGQFTSKNKLQFSPFVLCIKHGLVREYSFVRLCRIFSNSFSNLLRLTRNEVIA